MPIVIVRVARRCLTALAMVAALWTEAIAQDRDICLERDGARSIDACTRIIATAQVAGTNLATIYVLRASIYRANQDYFHAIDDITHAIELLKTTASNDVIASAYATRASFYSLSGDLAKALADYQQALALDATNAQAVEGVRSLQPQLGSVSPNGFDNQSAQQIAAPNEPLPADVPIPADVLKIIETNPFFANAPPVRVGGYSYEQLSSSKINGVRGTTSITYDSSVKWLKQGILSEQSIMQSRSSFASSYMRSETKSIEADNGLIGLGSVSISNTYIPHVKPIHGTYKTILKDISDLRGAPFPIHIGNPFSYTVAFQIINNPYPHDEMTESNQCQFTQQYNAQIFHPDLRGTAYLEVCQLRTSYSRNKDADVIGQSRTLFFPDLGIPVRVDPQNPPEKIIQTYFENEATETARLQSFTMAR